jgi:hypothetical protein
MLGNTSDCTYTRKINHSPAIAELNQMLLPLCDGNGMLPHHRHIDVDLDHVVDLRKLIKC